MSRIIALIIGLVRMDQAFPEWRMKVFPVFRAAPCGADTTCAEVIGMDEADLINARNALDTGEGAIGA